MKNYIQSILLLILVYCLSACGTPNDIKIKATPNQCVQLSQYEAIVQQPEAVKNYPFLANNPESAPQCVSITLTNNNSGDNANGVQAINTGLTISYYNDNLLESGVLYDPVASQVNLDGAPGAVPGTAQTLGGIVLFDPNNCVTPSGINMITLQPGNSCTFYLQLLGNTLPVDNYPTTVIYNYTNGNQNQMVSVNLNQRVHLYAGSESGLYYESTTAPNGQANSMWKNNIIGIPQANIGALTRDSMGNLYIGAKNQVFMFNGLTTKQLGESMPSPVTALVLDVNNNLYAGTESSGLFVYQNPTNTSSSSWQAFTDNSGNLKPNSNIFALQGQDFKQTVQTAQVLYAVTQNGAFKCMIPQSTTLNTSCNFTNITGNPPSMFNKNATAIDSLSNLYAASESNAYMFTESTSIWSPFTFNDGNSFSGTISGINFFEQTIPNTASANTTDILLSETNAVNQNESSVYTCVNNTCDPLLSVIPGQIGNNISGNADAVTTDGQGGSYVVGSKLNSADFTNGESNVTGAYLYSSDPASTSSSLIWQPIAKGDFTGTEFKNAVVTSIFTTY